MNYKGDMNEFHEFDNLDTMNILSLFDNSLTAYENSPHKFENVSSELFLSEENNFVNFRNSSIVSKDNDIKGKHDTLDTSSISTSSHALLRNVKKETELPKKRKKYEIDEPCSDSEELKRRHNAKKSKINRDKGKEKIMLLEKKVLDIESKYDDLKKEKEKIEWKLQKTEENIEEYKEREKRSNDREKNLIEDKKVLNHQLEFHQSLLQYFRRKSEMPEVLKINLVEPKL